MTDANPNPENPYAAPQVTPAELVPSVEPAKLRPGELPCHRCGQPVSKDTTKCPRCGSKPLYDGLELLVTALLMMAVVGPLWLYLASFHWDRNLFLGTILAVTMTLMFAIKFGFKKLRRGRW